MDKFNRPTWYDYYLSLAFLISRRSIDPSTQHGAVIVSKDNRLLSTGYNGPLKHTRDDTIPLVRPQKYYHILHAEENALIAYNGSFQDISEGTCYVTGPCCHKCLRMLMQKGITRIVQGHVGSAMLDEEDAKAKEIMLFDSGVRVIDVPFNDGTRSVLQNTLQYYDDRCQPTNP